MMRRGFSRAARSKSATTTATVAAVALTTEKTPFTISHLAPACRTAGMAVAVQAMTAMTPKNEDGHYDNPEQL